MARISVQFMGHLLTQEGLKADPGKVKALIAMPEPENATALKHFLRTMNYLTKFMPRFSDMTQPLHRISSS